MAKYIPPHTTYLVEALMNLPAGKFTVAELKYLVNESYIDDAWAEKKLSEILERIKSISSQSIVQFETSHRIAKCGWGEHSAEWYTGGTCEYCGDVD